MFPINPMFRNPATVLVHESLQNKNEKRVSTYIAYKTWDGSSWMAEFDGSTFYHYCEGKRDACHSSDHIDYISADGTKWSATLKDGVFFHSSKEDSSKDHEDRVIAYLTWDDTPFVTSFATWFN